MSYNFIFVLQLRLLCWQNLISWGYKPSGVFTLWHVLVQIISNKLLKQYLSDAPPCLCGLFGFFNPTELCEFAFTCMAPALRLSRESGQQRDAKTVKKWGNGEKKKWRPQWTGPLGAARKEMETLGTHEPCKYPVEGNAVPPSLIKLQGFELQRLQYQSLPKGIITQVCGGPLCPMLLEVMLHRPVLTQEDAWVRLNRRSERLLFSMALFPPAWARQLQRDAESGTSKPRSLSSSWNQCVLQIRKLHINALVLFLLIIFQHCLLIILTPWSNFSSHPLAAHFVLYSCHAHSHSKPAVP